MPSSATSQKVEGQAPSESAAEVPPVSSRTESKEVSGETAASGDAKEIEKETAKLPSGPRGGKCSLKHIFQHEKTPGQLTITEQSAKDKDDPYNVFAVVLKACYDAEYKLQKTTLRINSPHILQALKHVVKYYPSEPLEFGDGGAYETNHPYMLLHHHYEELQVYAAGDEIRDSSDALAHLKVLLDFLEADGRDARKLRDAKLIDFEHLWLIYKPGKLLFDSQYGQDRLYRISQIGYSESPQSGKSLGIRCTFTTCNGQESGTASEKLDILERQEFAHNTATPITSLSVFPLDFLGDEQDLEAIKASLVERGERYLRIVGVRVYQYEGLHLYLKSPPESFYNECASYSGTWLPATVNMVRGLLHTLLIFFSDPR